MQSSTSFIDGAGRRISFLESGSGVSIVLLPPGASGASAWRAVADELSARFRPIAVNPSGYADTDSFAGERPLRLDDEADAVLAVLAGDRDPAHLVGHSYGGAIALRLAARWPGRFRSLTLIEPANYPFLRQAGEDRLATEVERVNHAFIDQVRAGRRESAFESYFDYYNGVDGSWARLPENARRRLLSITATVAAALTAVHADGMSLRDCAKLSLPVLLVHGSTTDRVHARLTELIAREIPGAHLETVEGAGHMLTLTHPNVIARLIASHAGGSDGVRSAE